MSFGGKKLLGGGVGSGGRYFEDLTNNNKKSAETAVGNYSGSPQAHKGKYHGLGVSDQKSKKDGMLNTSNEETKGKGKNIPKFIANNANIKSSPYLPNKVSLDSSNEFSDKHTIKKPPHEPKDKKE